MQELMDLFLEKSVRNNSNIIYAQAYEDDLLKAEFKRFPQKTRLNVWSISKPFVAMAAGLAETEGILKRDELIWKDFAQYLPQKSIYEENIKKITVEHLLTMSSGLKEPLFFCDNPLRYQIRDWIRYFFTAGEFVHEPGTQFLYSNFNTYILSCMIEMRTGENLLNYLRYRLFEPIGIGNPDWTLCPQGRCMAANGLYLTIDELANFAHMLLHHGSYNGKQIVADSFIADACRKQIDTYAEDILLPDYESCGYGYFIRMAPIQGALLLSGNYGQYFMIYPDKNAVVGVMSLDGNNHKRIRNDLVDSIAEYYGITVKCILQNNEKINLFY